MAPAALLLFFLVILVGFVVIGLVGIVRDRREQNRFRRPKRRFPDWPDRTP